MLDCHTFLPFIISTPCQTIFLMKFRSINLFSHSSRLAHQSIRYFPFICDFCLFSFLHSFFFLFLNCFHTSPSFHILIFSLFVVILFIFFFSLFSYDLFLHLSVLLYVIFSLLIVIFICSFIHTLFIYFFTFNLSFVYFRNLTFVPTLFLYFRV